MGGDDHGLMIELVLFENDASAASACITAGISSFLVDTELMGKDFRQLGFNTEIRPGTFRDLEGVAAIPGATAWCRINRFGSHTGAEVNSAIDAGAGVVLLPMADSEREIEEFLDLLDGRCRAAIMVETVTSAANATGFAHLPLDYIFFGMNDFAISRGGGSIFRALADGSVERVRQSLPDLNFGVGGLTDIHLGSPIPSARLLEEMERLGCAFTFLRRSFRRDSKVVGTRAIVEGIRAYWRQCSARTDQQRAEDHDSLVAIIDHIENNGN